MTRSHRLTVLILAACVVPEATLAKKPPRCPDGGYVVIGRRLLAGDPAAAPMDLVEITGRRVSIASGCKPKRGVVQGTKQGTKVQAKWASCGQLRRKRST